MSSQHKLSNLQIERKWSLEFSFVVFAIVIFGPFYLVVLAFLELLKRFFLVNLIKFDFFNNYFSKFFKIFVFFFSFAYELRMSQSRSKTVKN